MQRIALVDKIPSYARLAWVLRFFSIAGPAAGYVSGWVENTVCENEGGSVWQALQH